MAEKVTVVVFKETGHVLAAVTRTGAAEAALEIGQLAGDGLPVRSFDPDPLQLTIAAEHLDAKIVDQVDRILVAPRGFAVVDDELTSLGPPLDSTKVTIDGTVAKIDLGAAATAKLESWLRIEGDLGFDPVTAGLTIDAGQQSGESSLPLSTGTYQVIAFVPGYEPTIVEKTLT